MASLIQYATRQGSTGVLDIVLGATPTPGNLLVLAAWGRVVKPHIPVGFDIDEELDSAVPFTTLAHRRVEVGDSATWPTTGIAIARAYVLMEWSGLGDPDDIASNYFNGTQPPDVQPGADFTIALFTYHSDIATSTWETIDPPASQVTASLSVSGASHGPWGIVGYRAAGAVGATIHAHPMVNSPQAYIAGNYPVDVPVEPPAHVPPESPNAILEIYTTDADSYRWDVALWDAATWGASGWQDISPYSVSAQVTWGATRADAGILTDMEAGTWTIETYDPDRVLDPANPDSPFYPDLVPDLPIRLSATNRVIRTGVVSRFLYFYAPVGKAGTGRILATDNVSIMARATVSESDSAGLSDLLRERARDAIAAAGLSITVLPDPPGGDAPLAPLTPGEYSVWEIVSAAARELLHIPYLDEHGNLGFRGWRVPKMSGAEIASPVLVDLSSWLDNTGLYSVVAVLDDDTSTVEIATLSPTPSYGRKVYNDRIEVPTIHGASWAETVLLDRQAAALRFVPGDIRPDTTADVDALAAIEIGEAVRLLYTEAEPSLDVSAIVMGASVYVVDVTTVPGEVRSRWLWRYATASRALEPLVDDDDVTSYLVSDQDGSYLYPDGVIGL